MACNQINSAIHTLGTCYYSIISSRNQPQQVYPQIEDHSYEPDEKLIYTCGCCGEHCYDPFLTKSINQDTIVDGELIHEYIDGRMDFDGLEEMNFTQYQVSLIGNKLELTSLSTLCSQLSIEMVERMRELELEYDQA